MTSQYPAPTKYRIRNIRPISLDHPCYIDLRAHPYHIYLSTRFLGAFSSLECAQHTVEFGLIHDCHANDRPQLVQRLRIIDYNNSLEYRRMGTWGAPGWQCDSIRVGVGAGDMIQ